MPVDEDPETSLFSPQDGVPPYVFITSLHWLNHGRFYEKRKVGGERKSLPLSAHSVDMSIGMRSLRLRPSPVHPFSRPVLVGGAGLQLGAAAPSPCVASVPPSSIAQRGRATPQALTELSSQVDSGILAGF